MYFLACVKYVIITVYCLIKMCMYQALKKLTPVISCQGLRKWQLLQQWAPFLWALRHSTREQHEDRSGHHTGHSSALFQHLGKCVSLSVNSAFGINRPISVFPITRRCWGFPFWVVYGKLFRSLSNSIKVDTWYQLTLGPMNNRSWGGSINYNKDT